MENKYGAYFKKLRVQKELSTEYFHEIVLKSTLNRFENGQSEMSITRLEDLLQKMEISLVDFISDASQDYINPQYGRCFKEIREQRGYHLDDYENVGVQAGELEAFEKGQYMFRFDKMEEIFENMSLVASDFHQILTDGDVDVFIDVFKQIEKYYHQNNKTALQKIYQEYMAEEFVDYRMVGISAKSCYSDLTEQEIVEVSDFLMGIDHWTTFELSVFSCVVNFLDYQLLRTLAKDFLKDKENCVMGDYYRKCLMQAVVKISLKFLKDDQMDKATKAINYARELLTTSDEYLRTIYFFTVGCWYHKRNNPEGLKLINRIIDYIDTIDDQVLKNRLLDLKKEFLKDAK